MGLLAAAKSGRQVIVFTHNTRVAVDTDADQVIIAEAVPHQHCTLPPISYRSGELENVRIRKAVCDTLEGSDGRSENGLAGGESG